MNAQLAAIVRGTMSSMGLTPMFIPIPAMMGINVMVVVKLLVNSVNAMTIAITMNNTKIRLASFGTKLASQMARPLSLTT